MTRAQDPSPWVGRLRLVLSDIYAHTRADLRGAGLEFDSLSVQWREVVWSAGCLSMPKRHPWAGLINPLLNQISLRGSRSTVIEVRIDTDTAAPVVLVRSHFDRPLFLERIIEWLGKFSARSRTTIRRP